VNTAIVATYLYVKHQSVPVLDWFFCVSKNGLSIIIPWRLNSLL